MKILVIGTLAFDNIETPFGTAERIVGGAANYIALSASYFTDTIDIVSIIGNDFPEDYLDFLSTRGINTQGIEKVANKKSFSWTGKYHLDMNTRDTLATDLNVLEDFNPQITDNSQTPDILMLGNLTPSIQLSVLNQMEKRPKLVVLDTMNFWMDTQLDTLLDVLKGIDVLTINDEEARQLSGEYSLKKASKRILQMGPKYLIIKKGENGALLFHEEKIFFAPALPLEEVFDPTGAGDTFAGGFIGHLAKAEKFNFETFKTALIHGSVMASFCVEDFGPKRLMNLDKKEINNRLQQFIDIVQFHPF